MTKLAIVLVILSLLLSVTITVGCGSGTCTACDKYICEGNPQWYLQLNADGTFINVADGFFKGTWEIDGNTITLKPQGPEWFYGGTTSVGTVQGNTLIHAGTRWVKQVEIHDGGGSTISYLATPQSTPKPTPATPIITNVSNISSDWTQTITIQGQGFGNLKPYNGNSPYIKITNITQGWDAGHDANWITLNISQWTDEKITIAGFTGLYGGPYRQLLVGDKLQINIWNPESGLGPASYTIIAVLSSFPIIYVTL